MRQDDQLIGMLVQAGVRYTDELLPRGQERMIEVISSEENAEGKRDTMLFMFDPESGLLLEVI